MTALQTKLRNKLSHLPAQLTSFIGRSNEIEEITRLLNDPTCRLLTLVGVGGTGKTRLAIQVATQVETNFTDGVHFVPLQAAESLSLLLSTVTEALNLSLGGLEAPEVQLLHYLQDKELLLILDNFEQLLAPPEAETKRGTDFITSLLRAAPGVKLLVTSREVLNLEGEWLYPVTGLPFPKSPLDTNLEAERYGAVQLFTERAQRVRRDFSLADEQASVIRICHLVEGVPLALELAAAWSRTLRCDVIATEIQRNLDFLATNSRNVVERQRSVRAVFQHSWHLLSEKECQVFKRLAVFRGGFQREAAEYVASATLETLTALADKSLVRSEPNGRYQVHELLRQYAAEQLVLSPEDIEQVYDLHCVYYTDFLRKRREDLQDKQQQKAIAEIAAELENIRPAWQWAVQVAKIEAIEKSHNALSLFFQFQSRYLEGATLLEKGVACLRQEATTPHTQLVTARLLVSLGWVSIRLGRLAEAEEMLLEAQTLYHQLDTSPLPGLATDPLPALGILATIRGDYAEAMRLGEMARQHHETRNDKRNLQLAYYVLAGAALAQGNYKQAQDYAKQAYTLTQETNDRWFMAYCLNQLGNVARAQGNYANARSHYQASFTLREEFNDPEGMAVALNCLGEIALLQEEFDTAESLYQQSLAIYRQINDRGGLATSLSGLAQVALALGRYPAAQQGFQQALQIAKEIKFVSLILSLLMSAGELLLRTGRTDRGAELLTLALRHPAGDEVTRAKIEQLLARYKLHPPSEVELDAQADLETLIVAIQSELTLPLEQAEDKEVEGEKQERKTGNQQLAPPRQSTLPPSILVETLTEREMEVLHLIVDGLQNREIAAKLVITLSTVKTHINNIYRKLDVTRRAQAVARAKELNLL